MTAKRPPSPRRMYEQRLTDSVERLRADRRLLDNEPGEVPSDLRGEIGVRLHRDDARADLAQRFGVMAAVGADVERELAGSYVPPEQAAAGHPLLPFLAVQ